MQEQKLSLYQYSCHRTLTLKGSHRKFQGQRSGKGLHTDDGGNFTCNSQGKHYHWVRDKPKFMLWERADKADGEGQKQRSEQKAKCSLHCQRPLQATMFWKEVKTAQEAGYQPIQHSQFKEVSCTSGVTPDGCTHCHGLKRTPGVRGTPCKGF